MRWMHFVRASLLAVTLVVAFGSQVALADAPFLDQRPLFYGAGNGNPALEIKMAPLSGAGMPQQLVIVSLYNQTPGTNILAGHVLDAPFNNGPVTFFDQLDAGGIFALGDGCRLDETAAGREVIFPFVRGSDLRILRFDGTQWVAATLSSASPYDSADCGQTSDGVIITGHRTDLRRIDIFHSGDGAVFNQVLCLGGTSDCLLGNSSTSSDDIFGPSQGATRDTLSTDPLNSSAAIIYQDATGLVQLAEVDPAGGTLNRHCGLRQFPPPTGIFNGVRESAAGPPGPNGAVGYTYSAEGSNYFGTVPAGSCPGANDLLLGPQESGPLGFQGATIINGGGPTNYNTLWGDYFLVDTTDGPGNYQITQFDDDYPAGNFDGPRAACPHFHDPGVGPPHPDRIYGASSRQAGGVTGYTFYGRYINDDGFEPREPLETTYFRTCP